MDRVKAQMIEMKEEVRQAVREAMPGTRFPGQEELVNEFWDLLFKHGYLQLMVMGKIAERFGRIQHFKEENQDDSV